MFEIEMIFLSQQLTTYTEKFACQGKKGVNKVVDVFNVALSHQSHYWLIDASELRCQKYFLYPIYKQPVLHKINAQVASQDIGVAKVLYKGRARN